MPIVRLVASIFPNASRIRNASAYPPAVAWYITG